MLQKDRSSDIFFEIWQDSSHHLILWHIGRFFEISQNFGFCDRFSKNELSIILKIENFENPRLQYDNEWTAGIDTIKLKLKLPPANDDATWKTLTRKLAMRSTLSKTLNDPGTQLERRETFIYIYLEEPCGVVTPPHPKKASGTRDRNMENLPKKQNLLKSNWNRHSKTSRMKLISTKFDVNSVP